MKLPDASSMVNENTVVDVEQVCPECGAAMVEFDRLVEDGAMFIWYACTREGCTGQWLAKRALRMCSM
jgi:hypothetical protein